ncbi:hypothetical protein C8R43DRAFT_1080050 [Mycena crocata]|nr:hypothetical protein C8R43DRAFT_1080050 [Mycena crocata]
MSSATREADRARIAEIDAQVRDLQTQRKVIQDRLDAYKYPVLTLPNEITSEIFLRLVPPYPSCPPVKRGLSPILLTHICRTWRNIALASPALWRAIRVVVRHVAPEKIETQTKLIDMWLNRSGSCSLSIQLDAHSVWQREGQLKLIQSLTAHCSRWEYVELEYLVPEMISFFSGQTPLLRHLQLSLQDIEGPPFFNMEIDGVTLLRSAVLGVDASGSVTLPWQQLTSLTLDPIIPRQCTQVLQQTPNLLHCELVLREDDSNEEGDVVLPCLQSLLLSAIEEDLWEYEVPINSTLYLSRFTTPALQRLEVADGPDTIAALVSFISRSGCKLQELQVVGIETVPKDLYHNAFLSIPKISFTICD